MGMFDSFYLEVICPHCEEKSIIEFQTKDFNCVMQVWKAGDLFNPSNIEIISGTIKDVYGGCNSKECREWEKTDLGYNSGFGRSVYCDVQIVNGRVEKAINVRKELEIYKDW